MFRLVKYTRRRLASLFRVSDSQQGSCDICIFSGFLCWFLLYIVADDILDCTATSAELGKTAGKDQDVNKTTYVKLLGLEQSKREALRIINEAKAALDRFGDRAVPLKALADFIVARKN